MFERKNVKLDHYSKMVGHDEENEEDDFMTIKRANHDLEVEPSNTEDQPLSKRKLKVGKSKKLKVKYGELGDKLVFDDEGLPHAVYEMKDREELERQGVDVVQLGQQFAAEKRSEMKVVDVEDKEVVKEKKREKKRKQKERERVSTLR